MRSIHLAATAALLTLTTTASSSKRGLCHVPSEDHPSDDAIWTMTPGSDLTWYYNYKYEPSDAYKNIEDLIFVPMLWGASDSDQGTPFLDSVKSQIGSGAKIEYVLGFNEPDGTHTTGGSDVHADVAARSWKAQIEPLKEMGVKLGAPAVTGSEDGFTWLENWFKACDGGCNPDFIPVHWYGNFEGMASHIGRVVAAYPNLTVWITEWGYPNVELGATQEFYNQSVTMLDQWSNITHYSYFGAFRSDVSNVGPNAAMLTEEGKLTDIGSWYLGGAATNNIPHKGAAGQTIKFASWSLAVLSVCVFTIL
ncbi:glycoside hydrolase family 128 protein [Lentithecium fluviatile CBS 122367]|uniref:Glycoside hydrolase family 128 protein n=1 Tax=Lentithecium fluviatile CBS 122367 TaxID=1168545 RepID=A0A6G1JBK6_9PLEO|nr:glycoside hydrolase family 128 protein [Lentithecium fluviatile CBS 122367]